MDGDLRNMVMSFRVTELQTLLAYAGKNKTGRKNELQARALDLVKSKSNPVVAKIKELYRSMQQSMATTGVATGTLQSGSYSSSSSGIPHNQTRLYVGSSGYGGSSEKVLQGISPFASYNNGSQPKSQPVVTMPICPDVKMKRLPFYDVVSELIKPTSLMPQGPGRVQEANYTFCLTPQQAADIAASKEYVAVSLGDQKLQFTMQIQLRFCALDTSCDQEDQFPPSICVKVNAKLVPLPHPIPSNRPGIEPKRPSRPLNVTNYVRLSPTMTNTVTVTWASDSSRGYAMSLYLVRKMTSSDLLNRLKIKGARPADYSRGMIKELIAKEDGDCMIAMTSLKVSIACPLGKCRMSLPCRATTCKHLQCFDANLFLQMNERKPTWACPVCDKPTLFENLCIDGYFQEVIGKMSGSESMDVELLPDGTWQALSLNVKLEKDDYAPPTKRIKSDPTKLNQTINLEDDIVIDEDPPKPSTSKSCTSSVVAPENEESKKKDSGPPVMIDLTIESDDEDSDDIPIRPRRKTGNPKYVIEDSSSSSSASSSTTEGSADTCPASPVRPMSPACITLDSRSPSPEAPASVNPTVTGSSNSGTGGAGAFSSVASHSQRERDSRPTSSSSASTVQAETRPSSSSTSFDYGTYPYLGQTSGYPSTRSNTSQQSQPVAPNLVAPGATSYLPYDGANLWGSSISGNYQNPYPSDFSQLDFQSMDYFNFDARGGNTGGYGRWT